jgi:hypothetical protein
MIEREGCEAERSYEKYEHVGVIEKVARLARDGRREAYARSVRVCPRVVYSSFQLFDC